MPLPKHSWQPSRAQHTLRMGVLPHTNSSSFASHFLSIKSQLSTLEFHCLLMEREGKVSQGLGVPLSVSTPTPSDSLPPWLGKVKSSLLSQLLGFLLNGGLAWPIQILPAKGEIVDLDVDI